jgi:hypothetical protein
MIEKPLTEEEAIATVMSELRFSREEAKRQLVAWVRDGTITPSREGWDENQRPTFRLWSDLQ